MTLCPYCRTENQPGGSRCAHCTSWIGIRREWTRARHDAMLGGVCRGIANHLGIPVAAVRLAFLIGLLCGGWGLLFYLFLWIAMPKEPLLLPPHVQSA